MIWKSRDSSDFVRVFAYFPLKIQGLWIWLEFYDATGWYYDTWKNPDDLIKSRRYPSQLKANQPK